MPPRSSASATIRHARADRLNGTLINPLSPYRRLNPKRTATTRNIHHAINADTRFHRHERGVGQPVLLHVQAATDTGARYTALESTHLVIHDQEEGTFNRME